MSQFKMMASIRRFSATSRAWTGSSSATRVASDFLRQTQAQPPLIQTQYLDANQLQKLGATLDRPSLSRSVPPIGTILPPGYHLAYFTPSQLESELGADGTDTSFNPPAPFTRRMWAGGEISWPETQNLQVGQTVRETTKLVSSEGKITKAGEEMVVVGVEKEYKLMTGDQEGETLMLDRRNWIFRRALDPSKPSKPLEAGPPAPFPQGAHTLDLTQTPVTLFRFSALTFNGHMIHYSKEWCQNVEGHRNLVVHGPLNLVKMLDFWRDVYGISNDGSPRKIKKISYRATSPIYANEKYRIVMDEEKDGKTDLRIVDGSGKLGMKGTIERY